MKIGVESLTGVTSKLNCEVTNGVRARRMTPVERGKFVVYCSVIKKSGALKFVDFNEFFEKIYIFSFFKI